MPCHWYFCAESAFRRNKIRYPNVKIYDTEIRHPAAKGEFTMTAKYRLLYGAVLMTVLFGLGGCASGDAPLSNKHTHITETQIDTHFSPNEHPEYITAEHTDTDSAEGDASVSLDELILRDGVPYAGELNGKYDGNQNIGASIGNIVIFEKEITVTNTPSGGLYEGTLSYDGQNGDLQLYLKHTYEKNGTTYEAWGKRASGKLYEYRGDVYFICEATDISALRENSAPIRLEGEPEPCTTVSYAEWAALEFPKYERPSDTVFYMIRALLSGDIHRFASLCGVSSEVYGDMSGIKITSHRLYTESIAAEDKPENVRTHAVLEFTVSESNSEFFSVGTYTLVFDEGLAVYFTPREKFRRYAESSGISYTPAMLYVEAVGFEDFYAVLGEGRSQFGLCDFIVARLDALAGDYKPHTAEEIKAYAEKYLGVDGNTLNIERSLESVEGGYVRIGRGKSSYMREYISEEIRDGLTVVTVCFFADYSKTVTSRLVEFYLDFKDGEYIPVKTEILLDNGFTTASLST